MTISSRHAVLAVLAALATAGAGACTGEISNPGGGDDDDDVTDPGESSRFARLTHAQWENTVQDLFQLAEPPGLADSFQPDPPLGRFSNNILRLSVTAGHWQDYQRAAETMGERVAGDPAILAAIVPADLPADPGEAARAFVSAFGQRAFRRPLDATEVDRYAALFAEGTTHYPEHDATTAGVRLVVEAMLQSPYFLYRTETSNEVTGGSVKLSGYEVASRLSYALWNTMPDQALFDAAASGVLDTADGVREHALRLFDDPRTRAQFDDFHYQAFSLREWTDVDKDPALYPQWSRELGAAMQTEAQMFLADVVFEGGTIGDFMTSTRAYVNDELAALYGISGEFGASFEQVELDAAERAGFITRAGFLARNATLRQPDPIHRGVFINLDLLCRTIAAVPDLPDDLNPVGDTNRERINSITGPGTCGEACHGTIINPLGFALESYGALGEYRTEDNGFPVNTADAYVFPDGRRIEFTDAIDLSRQLADAPELHSCYVRQMLEYLYGRDLAAGDDTIVSQLASESVGEGLAVREVVIRTVTSDAFRFRSAD